MNLTHFQFWSVFVLNRSIFKVFKRYSFVLFVYSHRMNQVFTWLTELVPITVLTDKYGVLCQTSFAHFFTLFNFTFPLLEHFKYDWILLKTACFIPIKGFWAELTNVLSLFLFFFLESQSAYSVQTTGKNYRVLVLRFPIRNFKLTHI